MTFESVPPDYSSVNDHLMYVVYDAHAADPVTYPNYKYIAELWIGATKVHTKRMFPQPDTNRGEFDFGAVAREYIIANLAPSGAGILAQELTDGQWSIKDVVVKIREEYGGTVGAVILTDSARTFFNHYNGRFNDFTLLAPYADKPISNRPVRIINLLYTCANYYIPYFSETTTPFDVVVTPDTPVSTVTVTVTPTVVNSLQLINIAPGAVNTHVGGAIDNTTGSYTVVIGSETYYVNIVCPGFYTNYLVHFLNKFGGFESMLFNKVSRKTVDVERKKWQQLPYRIDGSGVVSVKTGSIMHAQQSTFAARFKESLKISTDWLSDAEYQWLAELVCSPFIYVEDNGTLYPVTLTDTNYEFKENIVDGLQNLSISVEFGTTFKTQFR